MIEKGNVGQGAICYREIAGQTNSKIVFFPKMPQYNLLIIYVLLEERKEDRSQEDIRYLRRCCQDISTKGKERQVVY